MNAINVEELLERCMGVHSIMETVLAEFRDLGEEMLRNIETRLDEGAWRKASEAAHSLKGASGNISAESLHALAAKMEICAEKADAEACNELRQVLRREMELCLHDISEILNDCPV
ncbi:MAG: Hpt domain-containing protein [Phycisphaerae bacterium]|nr:Hpt domain-containing protein [Phycisphaerae bacterium]